MFGALVKIRRKPKADAERKLLINLIISTPFLKEIAPILNPKDLESPYAETVVTWILEYFKTYEEAPNKAIEDIYFSRRDTVDEEEAELIGDLLKSLNDEYIIHNVSYSIEQTIAYLKKRSLTTLLENLEAKVSSGQLIQAEEAIGAYNRIEQSKASGVDILDDLDGAYDAFFSPEEELFTLLAGEAGELIGPFHRGDFIGFLAFAKRGKSFALLNAAEDALYAGLNVLYFNLEISELQIKRRIYQGLFGVPRIDQAIRIPFFEIAGDNDYEFDIDYYSEDKKGIPNNPHEFEQLFYKTSKLYNQSSYRLITIPAKSATVEDLITHMNNLEYYEGFIPDVVFVDYADLLSPSRKIEYRHQLDDIWSKLRRIALERDICVFTASQSSRESSHSDVKEHHVSEDIRKLAHVTRMIGINCNRHDRESQVTRLSILVDREYAAQARDNDIVLLQCLDICRFILDAKLLKVVSYAQNNGNDEKGKSKYS